VEIVRSKGKRKKGLGQKKKEKEDKKGKGGDKKDRGDERHKVEAGVSSKRGREGGGWR